MLKISEAKWPSFTQEEADAVSHVLLSNKVNYWTGQEGREFEKEFAQWSGAKHAIALTNGTVALDLALVGLGIGAANGGDANDEVVVTPRTFIASTSTVVNAGARPIMADVDADSGNITAATIKAVLTPKTKAVIAVHLAGWPCDLDPIMALCEEHGIKLIEDCAQAHGARYKGRPVGAIGHVGAWSFCQDKIMTTGGEGGMVTTNDSDLWSAMWSYKDHGKSYDAVYNRTHAPGFRWLHESFGTNWRMTEIQAVLGRIQLRRMPDWAAARQRNANIATQALTPFAGESGVIRLPPFKCATCTCQDAENRCVHAQYKYYAYVRPENLANGWSRDRIVEEISAKGVPAFQGSCSEVYLEKAFDGASFRPKNRLPTAQDLGDTSLMFLVHPTIEKEAMVEAMSIVAKVLSQTMSQ